MREAALPASTDLVLTPTPRVLLPARRYRNFRLNNMWSPRQTRSDAALSSERDVGEGALVSVPYGKPSGPYAAPYTYEARGPVMGSTYVDGATITQYRRSSRESHAERAERPNRFSDGAARGGGDGRGRGPDHRTSPNGPPLGRSRSAAAGTGISNSTFAGVSHAITPHSIAGIPSRRESWMQASNERSRDAGLYA
jgi:hypothetical protein